MALERIDDPQRRTLMKDAAKVDKAYKTAVVDRVPFSRPSANITWFQANDVCRAGGKRLPLGDEWLAAASGTVDSDTTSWINPANTATRMTNAAGLCRSAWGAQDMIGNVTEWTAEWHGDWREHRLRRRQFQLAHHHRKRLPQRCHLERQRLRQQRRQRNRSASFRGHPRR